MAKKNQGKGVTTLVHIINSEETIINSEETIINSEETIINSEETVQLTVPAEIYFRTSLEKFNMSLKDLPLIAPIYKEPVFIPHLGNTFVIKCAVSGDLLLPESEIKAAVAELLDSGKPLLAREVFYLNTCTTTAAKPEWLVAFEETL